MVMSRRPTSSSNLRPMRRLMANRVLWGLVTAWRLAGWRTSTSPSWVRASVEGGGGAIALAVLDRAGLAPLHDGHARVGLAEVDTDYLCHGFTPRNLCHKRDARASS